MVNKIIKIHRISKFVQMFYSTETYNDDENFIYVCLETDVDKMNMESVVKAVFDKFDLLLNNPLVGYSTDYFAKQIFMKMLEAINRCADDKDTYNILLQFWNIINNDECF